MSVAERGEELVQLAGHGVVTQEAREIEVAVQGELYGPNPLWSVVVRWVWNVKSGTWHLAWVKPRVVRLGSICDLDPLIAGQGVGRLVPIEWLPAWLEKLITDTRPRG